MDGKVFSGSSKVQAIKQQMPTLQSLSRQDSEVTATPQSQRRQDTEWTGRQAYQQQMPTPQSQWRTDQVNNLQSFTNHFHFMPSEHMGKMLANIDIAVAQLKGEVKLARDKAEAALAIAARAHAKVLETSRTRAKPCEAHAEASEAGISAAPRTELIDSIFQVFDADRSGALEEAELLEFVWAKEFAHLRRSDKDWSKKFANLRNERGWAVNDGIDRKRFGELVSGNGEYRCSDEQLKDIAVAVMLTDVQTSDVEDIDTARRNAETREVQEPECYPALLDAGSSVGSDRPKSKLLDAMLDAIAIEERPNSKLLNAIADEDIDRSLFIISTGRRVELNEMDSFGGSALHLAAEKGLVPVCNALLASKDFDHVNARDWSFASTALHYAALNGHTSVCLALLNSQRFNRSNDRNSEGNTALHNAAKEGHAEACKLLLDHSDFTEANWLNFHGHTALHLAALYARADAAEVLKNHGKFTKEHARSEWGTTAAELRRRAPMANLMAGSTHVQWS